MKSRPCKPCQHSPQSPRKKARCDGGLVSGPGRQRQDDPMTSLTGQGWKIEGKRGEGRLVCNKPQAKRAKSVFILMHIQITTQILSWLSLCCCLLLTASTHLEVPTISSGSPVFLLRNHIGPMWILCSFPKFSLQNTLELFVSDRLYFWFFFLCFFWHRISFCRPGRPRTYYGSQVRLRVTTMSPASVSEGLSHLTALEVSSWAWHCRNLS